jgi:hypothetical protein
MGLSQSFRRHLVEKVNALIRVHENGAECCRQARNFFDNAEALSSPKPFATRYSPLTTRRFSVHATGFSQWLMTDF